MQVIMSTNSSTVSDDMGYLHFGWFDHSAFILMLALSTVVGLIVGLCGKQDTKVDYLHGGKTMGYLELRFSPQVRVLASVLFATTILLYIPIVIYVPALAFNQVSGGGLKAVVWTDFLQSFVTVGSSLSVIVIGLWRLGGPQVVWQRSYEGGRLELFNMDPSPFVRSTFWTVTVGMTFAWLFSLAASQGMVQKFISLPDIKSARS
uniref:Uncharacterized protein n=1 Tax=Timema bartmani TaxID=61472 RepID=A0A7R9HW81_9NEOP|nr:unnamed protein product [Timema bartmani]